MKLIVVIISLLLLFQPSGKTYSQTQDFYEKGLTERQAGRYSNALSIWLEGKYDLSRSGQIDPRIGVAFIELAAELGNKIFRKKATELYMWAFSGNSIKEYKETFTGEVERLLPLLEEKERNVWSGLLQANDPYLLTVIRGFWYEHDLTPATELNERLIEHWERIIHARKNFTRNDRSPYGTDDRGTIYVRYGEPDDTDAGVLGDNALEFYRRIADIGEGNISKGQINLRGDFPIPLGQIMKMHLNPEYEIWIYEEHRDDDKGIFVFGKPADDSFGLYDSIEELISREYFLLRNELRAGNMKLSPAFLMQLVYYNQLSIVDEFFALRYDELKTLWDSPTPQNPGITKANSQKFLFRDREDPVKRFAPREKSEFEIIPITIESHLFRFMDIDNNPRFSVIALSHPDTTIFKKVRSSIRPSLSQAQYRPIHTLIVRDGEWKEVKRYTRTNLDSVFHVSTYILGEQDRGLTMTLAAEASAYLPDNDSPDSTLFVPYLGKVELVHPPFLDPDYSQLELSDLITGIGTPDFIDKNHYPYPVLPVEQVRQGEFLHLYMEIYHLQTGIDAKAQYSITFQIESQKKEGVLTRLFQKQKKELISITSNFDAESNRSTEHIAFDISNLEQSEYEFQVIVTDLLSGQIKTRKGTFVVIQ